MSVNEPRAAPIDSLHSLPKNYCVKISKVLWAAVVSLLLLSAHVSAGEPLYCALEKVRKDYYAAVKARDVAKVRQRLSSFQFSSSMNQATIRPRSFLDYFFRPSTQDHPDLRETKRYATVQRNGTVCQTYYAMTRTTDVEGEFKNQLAGMMLVVHFVRENGKWKFDEEAPLYLSPEDCRRILRKQKLTWIIRQVMQPQGKVLPAQSLLKPMPLLGIVKVSSPRFKIQKKINGGGYIELIGEALPIYTGLRSGVNKISILAEPLGDAAAVKKSRPQVEIFASRSERMFNDGVSVFKLRLKDIKSKKATEVIIDDSKIPASPDEE